MFEEYLQDAYEFYTIAVRAATAKNDREARRYFRASVFYAAGAIEAYVNYITDSFAKGRSLKEVEIAYLNDQKLAPNPSKGEVDERTEFHALEDKIKYLLNRFQTGFDFQDSSWIKLMEFKRLRDSLVHPRQSEDETEISIYKNKVRAGLSGIIEISNAINQGIFKVPLRKQLTDLIPD